LDHETEAVVTIGSKEGLSHLALSIIGPGDLVMVPAPTYPIHTYGVIIANGVVVNIPVSRDQDFFEDMERTYKVLWPRPKVLVINFPHNPTTACVDLPFFQRVVDFAQENQLIVIHDFAYAVVAYDGYEPPSLLDVP
ncbi:aminotransferase class I/II-fold pyridoxal phosphate-dependent enzyme, partial [Nitrospinae bacterium AH_259_B05_G02_I21]|nr:aminotransferase class I/II-fold pyridoxal phosphate-dependent enzyme [Nitrospinae bacterium AH_259_B05_G02_I21]